MPVSYDLDSLSLSLLRDEPVQYATATGSSRLDQSPLVAVDVNLHKSVTFKASWNYFVAPASRYFHVNNATLALRYSF